MTQTTDQEILVSVYVPTRNRLSTLQRAIDSVLAQTHRSLELIVVDDGSSDGTSEYLRQKSLNDPRVTFIRNSASCGAPAARNSAIKVARGHFVTGLDDDDEFLPHRIESFVAYWNLLASNEVKPAFLYAQDIEVRSETHQAETRRVSSVKEADMYEFNCVGGQIFAPKSHYIEAGLFDEALPAWQDLEFFTRILRHFGTARLLDIPTYVFDAKPRPDRITRQAVRVRAAFELVSGKLPDISPRQRQALYLQIFSADNGIRPELADWIRFLGWGFWLGGVRRLLRASKG